MFALLSAKFMIQNFLECVTVTVPTLYNLEEVIFFEIFLEALALLPLPFNHVLEILVVIGRFECIR